ncbi:hypothetical protein D623_10024926 [Myotis brandtii]|uniref:Uncharacterized protein n=1 Tax=Myotis brandtii TaxID=109478 RepID=S7PYQ2_MYOBR|nr:hypothetical protein D623_10024926 [Myotis brandtii]
MSAALWFHRRMTPLETPSPPQGFPLAMSPLSPILGGGQSSYDDKSKVKQQDVGGEAGTGASLPIPGFSQRAQTGPRTR